MKVTFYKGILQGAAGEPSQTCWAETPHGIMVCADEEEIRVTVIQPPGVLSSDPVTTVDMTGVDRDGLEVLVANILCRGYLDKPGVRNGGDAVLYILVNEALHQMAWIRKKHLTDD